MLQTLRERFYAGIFGWPQQMETKVAELIQLVAADFKANNYKSLKSAEQLQASWNAFQIERVSCALWISHWGGICEGQSIAAATRSGPGHN